MREAVKIESQREKGREACREKRSCLSQFRGAGLAVNAHVITGRSGLK